MKQETHLLSIEEVVECCAISRATIYRLMKKGFFPSSVKAKGCRRIAWRSDDINRWMNSLEYTTQT